MKYVIETSGLTKTFGPVVAVDGLDLRVRPGEIYGFLGLNGAGKTTTIRALLGMIAPTAGSVRLFGRKIGPNGHGPWAQVGYLVEPPAAYPDLTTRENLEIARRLQALPDRQAVERILEQLQIAAYADKKAGTLSTGNLQRLALARALLHSPKLLLLDEPANGLDPAGVVEIRQLLASLARAGVTILMSSHILTEVDRLATRIGIIHKGRLIEELDAGTMEQLRAQRLEVRARDMQAAQAVLREAGYSVNVDRSTRSLALTDSRAIDAPDEVARLLVQAGLAPTQLNLAQQNLEDHFLRLTGVQK